MVETFAHAAGLLLLAHTGRIRMFDVSARELMLRFVDGQIARLGALSLALRFGSGGPDPARQGA